MALRNVSEACDDEVQYEGGRIRSIDLKPCSGGDSVSFENIRGSKSCDAVTGEGYGGNYDRLLYYNHTIELDDPDYLGNQSAWAGLNGKLCEVTYYTEKLAHSTNALARVLVMNKIEDGLDSDAVWHVQIKWRSKDPDTASDS